jgi:hypothetical protein
MSFDPQFVRDPPAGRPFPAQPTSSPKTAFSRFPSVHRADLEGQERVRFDPFAAPSGNAAPSAIAAARRVVVRGAQSRTFADKASERAGPTATENR